MERSDYQAMLHGALALFFLFGIGVVLFMPINSRQSIWSHFSQSWRISLFSTVPLGLAASMLAWRSVRWATRRRHARFDLERGVVQVQENWPTRVDVTSPMDDVELVECSVYMTWSGGQRTYPAIVLFVQDHPFVVSASWFRSRAPILPDALAHVNIPITTDRDLEIATRFML